MLDPLHQILAVGSGGLVGFTLGLIGGGGSILATPLLLYVVGLSNPHVAIGTGALAVSVNAFVNFAGHSRCGNVRWREAVVFALVGTLGAFAGSSLGKLVDGQRLLVLFALLMIVVGVLMLRPRQPDAAAASNAPGSVVKIGGAALAAGGLSGFFGIGGGFLIVPALLLSTGIPLIQAIGSSLLAVGAFGLATAVNYAVSGLVDWLVAAEYVAGGIAGGVLGMGLAIRLAPRRTALNRIFAGVIFTVAAYMLYRNAAAFGA